MSKSIAAGGLSQFSPSVPLSSGIVDWAQGNIFNWSISSSQVISFNNNTDGRTIVIKISNTSASNVTLTWPMNVVGADTTLAANKTKIFTLMQISTSVYLAVVEY